MRRATQADVPILISLMADFYAESGYDLDRSLAERAFLALIADERLGRVWLIEAGGESVGHAVVTLRFGMEYAGILACIDDLYVKPQARRQGLASAALSEIRDFCEATGVCAITVEVAHDNGAAQAAYRRLGLSPALDRQLLSLALAKPAHAV